MWVHFERVQNDSSLLVVMVLVAQGHFIYLLKTFLDVRRVGVPVECTDPLVSYYVILFPPLGGEVGVQKGDERDWTSGVGETITQSREIDMHDTSKSTSQQAFQIVFALRHETDHRHLKGKPRKPSVSRLVYSEIRLEIFLNEC